MTYNSEFLFFLITNVIINFGIFTNAEFNVQGKVALVTGGSQGIGLQIVNKLLNKGIRGVTIVDINYEIGNEAAKSLNEQFGQDKVLFVQADITNNDEFEDAFRTSKKHWNGLDILINNAGVFNENNWKLMVNVNAVGTLQGTLLGYKYMSKSNRGRGGVIINISSVAGIDPYFYLPIHTATKHFIVGLGRALGHSVYYDYNEIRIITVCPGPTSTGKINFLDTLSDALTPYIREAAARDSKGFPQSTTNVANGVAKIIKEGENGSVWVIEDNQPPYEVQFRDRKFLKKRNQ